MTNYPYRVMTRGEFAYVVNITTMERVDCYSMWEGQKYRFNCDRFAPGYIKAQEKCKQLNEEYENDNNISQRHSNGRQPHATD